MTPNPLHIYFVLDRSGSMESIRADVIGGFNTFMAEQKAQTGDDVRFTLVQFDNQDTHEVIYDAVELGDVLDLDVGTFVPRGGTPLFDAMARVITDAKIRAEARADVGGPTEDVIFVTFTDGGENASREYDRAKVFDLIKKQETKGWTFVYLGANQDAYAEGGQIGYQYGNTQNFMADSAGVAAAYVSTSKNLTGYRTARKSGGIKAGQSLGNFFASKEAEDLMTDPDELDELATIDTEDQS